MSKCAKFGEQVHKLPDVWSIQVSNAVSVLELAVLDLEG